MNKESQLHAGHRERARKQFLERGLEGMPDHAVLELLLFYAIPVKDTNPLAHRLIDRFGSLQAVFDAETEELLAVPGVGYTTAVFLKLMPALSARYLSGKQRKRMTFSETEKAAEVFIDYYRDKTGEEATALLLDSRDRLIAFVHLQTGSLNSTPLNTRRIVEAAMNKRAASIILAHNHPSGDPTPSAEDISLTRHLLDAFIPIDLTLKGHLVIAGSKFTDVIPVLYKGERFRVRYIAVTDGVPTRDGGAAAAALRERALHAVRRPPRGKGCKVVGICDGETDKK